MKVTVPTTLESPLKAAIAYNKLACVSIEVSDRGQSYNDEKKIMFGKRSFGDGCSSRCQDNDRRGKLVTRQ